MMNEFIYAVDLAEGGGHRIVWVMGAYEHITGYPRTVVKSWDDFVHGDDKRIYRDHILRVLHGEEHTAEFRIYAANGDLHWVRDRMRPLMNDKGRVAHIHGVATDITERVNAQERLQASLVRHAVVADLGVLALNSESPQDLANYALVVCEKLLSVALCEVLLYHHNASDFELLAERGILTTLSTPTDPMPNILAHRALATGDKVVVDDTSAESALKPSPSLLRRGIQSCACVVIHGKKGALGVLTAYSSQVARFGENEVSLMQSVASVIGSHLERHRTQEAEKLQRDFAEGLREAVTMLVNERELEPILHKLLSYLTEVIVPQAQAATVMLIEEDALKLTSQVGYHDVQSLFDADSVLVAALSKKYQRLVRDHLPVIIPDTQRDSDWVRTEPTLWVRSYMGVPIVVKGVCIGIINLDSDRPNAFLDTDLERVRAFADKAAIAIVNAQRAQELEREVRERTAELQAEKAQQARFIANAAHELRTPITNLNTRIYLLQRTPEELAAHLSALQRLAQRMNRLVSDLLDMANFEHGLIKLNKQSIILQDVVADVVALQRPEAEKKGIALLVEQPEAPTVLIADEHRLQQVLTNLITNAILYTPEGGTITVSLHDGEQCGDECQHPDEEAVKLRVRDTGAGIPPESLELIFQPFYRLQSQQSGTGLGLTIVQEIVRQHGGSICVESTVGEGSTFTVCLPKRVL
jgi:PAS domain S-box-containing protein